MNLLECMDRANELRPNDIREELKAQWVNVLEGDVANLMGVDAPADPFPEDGELLLPHPWSYCYVYYLCAMIDWAQKDFDIYYVDYEMFNSLWAQMAAWWAKEGKQEAGLEDNKRLIWKVM